MPYAFDFAVSFSGECRSRAEELSKLLVEKGARVFYDNFYLEHLLGKRLDKELSSVFGEATRYFVPFVSLNYAAKSWPQYEWSIAKLEALRRDQEFILPLRIDDTLLVGLPDTVCYLDLRNMSSEEVANILYRKLEASSDPIDIRTRIQRWAVTFGLLIEKFEELPLPKDVQSKVPALYDWLIEDLKNRLKRTAFLQTRVVEDLRTGETLSVRLCFEWDPSKGALNFGNLGWWDPLALDPYQDIYGRSDCE